MRDDDNMGFSDDIASLDPTLLEEWEDELTRIGLLVHPSRDSFGDPKGFWEMGNILWHIGLEDEAYQYYELFYSVIHEWEKDTGLVYDTYLDRWRDPESGQFVKAPYHDEKYLEDPEFVAKYGIE